MPHPERHYFIAVANNVIECQAGYEWSCMLTVKLPQIHFPVTVPGSSEVQGVISYGTDTTPFDQTLKGPARDPVHCESQARVDFHMSAGARSHTPLCMAHFTSLYLQCVLPLVAVCAVHNSSKGELKAGDTDKGLGVAEADQWGWSKTDRRGTCEMSWTYSERPWEAAIHLWWGIFKLKEEHSCMETLRNFLSFKKDSLPLHHLQFISQTLNDLSHRTEVPLTIWLVWAADASQ